MLDAVAEARHPPERAEHAGDEAIGIGLAVQMRGQDEQRLEQRNNEHHARHDRQSEHELGGFARHREQRHEGDDIGGDREDDRQRHFLHALHHGLAHGFALFISGEYVLSDNDRIIDHDAEREDEGEHGDHVDRLAHGPEHGERPDQHGGNRHRHPERQPQIEKQPQEQHDQ